MNKTINFKENRGVMSLVVVLVIGLFALAAALTVTGQMVVEIKKGTNTISGDRSFHTAEAASREGTYQYLSDSSYSYGGGDPQLINETSEGSISVTTPVDKVAHREITGAAKHGLSNLSTNRKVIYTLVFDEALAFEYGLYSADNINLGPGNASVKGNTFSNGSTTVAGASEIDGDAAAVGTVTGNVTGSKAEGENPIDFPEINIDFNEYEDEATLAGTLYVDAGALGDDLRNVNSSGIFFASTTDPVSINGPNTYLLGSLVTLGDLTVINNQKFESTGGYEAVVVAGNFTMNNGEIEGNVYVEGNFEMHGGTIKGIVYVKGGTTFGAGNWTIEGALISFGEIQMHGCGGDGIIYDPNIVTNWFEFAPITNPPRIISWQEE